MRASKVCFRRTFNLGNYESETIELEVELSEGDDAKKALEGAKKFVLNSRQNKDAPIKAGGSKGAQSLNAAIGS